MQRFTALTCSALARSVYAAASTSPHTVSVQLLSQGLHKTPKNLRQTLQDAVDPVQPGDCDAILLAYGMCGTSVLGVEARQIPLVIPRAHDCITLYLGSRERYQEEFNAHPGTYWYSLDYLERNDPGSYAGFGSVNLGMMDDVYDEYVQKYGQENADYLMEVMGEWGKHYTRAVYIDMGLGDGQASEAVAREQAQRRGWLYERKQGSHRLINMLLHGEWADDLFLVVPPGHSIQQSDDDGLIRAVKTS